MTIPDLTAVMLCATAEMERAWAASDESLAKANEGQKPVPTGHGSPTGAEFASRLAAGRTAVGRPRSDKIRLPNPTAQDGGTAAAIAAPPSTISLIPKPAKKRGRK